MRPFAYCLLLILCCAPPFALACKPSAAHPLKALTEEEKLSAATLVFVGTVINFRKAPELKSASRHSDPAQVTLAVRHWQKGSGGHLMELVDTTGTDCDPLMGISHIAMDTQPLSSTWRVYARESQGRVWIITADRINNNTTP